MSEIIIYHSIMVAKVEEEYKKLVRKKLRVKRVTKRAQQNVWDTLNQTTKNKFGGWKPANAAPVTVALKPTNVCVLGKGAYGKACVRETPAGVKYVVKTSLIWNASEIIRERNTHIKLYYKLPQQLRKYFPRPVLVKNEPDSYAMTMFDGITLQKALSVDKSAEYKTKVIKQLRKAIFAMWSSGYIHGDVHSENIMVSRDQKNPTIQILDFGMMRKSPVKIPNKRYKMGSVGYKNLTNNWHDWFRVSWKKQLKDLNLNQANPNMIVFPKEMNNLTYFATQHSRWIFDDLNKYGNVATPNKAKSGVMAKARLNKYKALVRQRMGVKRVTKQAQIFLWSKLSNKNKEQFGTWKPEGVVKHRTTPPRPIAPTTYQQITRDFLKAGGRVITYENLLRFWMTHYTTAQKKALYKKVRDPEKGKKDYPLCK